MNIHLLRGKEITVNGARIGRLPRRYGAVADDSGHVATSKDQKTPVLALDKAGLFVIVSAPSLGLSVLWDGGM